MTSVRKCLLVPLIVGLAAGFAACGDDGADSPTQAGTTTQAIRRRKRLPFRKC
jgi:hypothetical protein